MAFAMRAGHTAHSNGAEAIPAMRLPVPRLLRRGAIGVLLLVVLLLTLRIWDTQRGPPLRPWHQHVPQELSAAELDAADWPRFLAAERAAFDGVAREVSAHLEPEDRVAGNRYFPESPLFPGRFAKDWNRSFLLAPEGPPRGAVVLLHGLTDAPYSLRHVAEHARASGWVAVAPRMTGHGTVPAGLTEATWEEWMAATRLAMREARARAGADAPLVLVGYSNGGALALKHALDALEDPRLPRAERVVLISPMIGVTAFARFAGFAALPALLPRFAKTAWLSILPEFNPFKFNSFPVNAARQSHLLTDALQQQVVRLAREGRLGALPPVLTFQSVVDATVSTPAVLSALYAHLPANGSEIVIFDINRNTKLGPLVAPGAVAALERLLPSGPRAYRATVVTNADPDSAEAVARSTAPGTTEERAQDLGLAWPRELFSLSHIALPFPVTDGLYGIAPDPADDFGVRLGAVAVRGERGVLMESLDSLIRVSSNPFFPYMLGRIDETLDAAAAARR
jgi:alpha-beta hydrolase superfamily lysophospholipase